MSASTKSPSYERGEPVNKSRKIERTATSAMAAPSSTMKEAHVSKDTTVTVQDVPIPHLTEPHSILVEVHVAGINPKDWKLPAGILTSISDCPNSGDDIAGIVAAVHPTVKNFKPGDRVAGLHRLGAPHGAFAQFAITHTFSTFHLPASLSFTAASTLPMATFMSGMALFAQLRVAPGPFLPLTDPRDRVDATRPGTSGRPLLIYGASSSVGAMAVRLAQAANVHPLLCVAGAGCPKVATLIDEAKGDRVFDYRVGAAQLVTYIRAAVPPRRDIKAAFDVISEHGSWKVCGEVLAPNGRLTITLPPAKEGIPESIEQTATMAGSLWGGLKSVKGEEIGDLGFKGSEGRKWGDVWARVVEGMLEQGELGCPDVEVVEGGLETGLEKALRRVRWEKEGKRFAVRVVAEDDDEKGAR